MLPNFSQVIVEFHGLGAYQVVATVDSGAQELQWFGNSVAGLVQKKKIQGPIYLLKCHQTRSSDLSVTLEFYNIS